MKRDEVIELQWKVNDLERRLKASNDLILYFFASISGADSSLSSDILRQFLELKDDGDMNLRPDFKHLIARSIEALSDGPLDLESVD